MDTVLPSHISILTVRFTTVIQDPFNGEYTLSPFELDPASFTDENLKALKSFTVSTQIDDKPNTPDLRTASVFEFEIDTTSRAYKRILDEGKPGPPIKRDIFHTIEDAQKTLTYGLIKYMAWQYGGLDVGEPHTKVKQSAMRWEFNGVASTEPSEPQWEIVNIYRAVQDRAYDISRVGIHHFYKLYDAGLDIPLHQELLMEVRSLMLKRRRSAYLILYSTLEVATKNLIKTLRPDTDYFISKIQSPDLYRLYIEYVNPEISELVSVEEAKLIRVMGTTRNNIAHRGDSVNADTLQKHYELVVSLIKKIESLMGYV